MLALVVAIVPVVAIVMHLFCVKHSTINVQSKFNLPSNHINDLSFYVQR